MNSARIRRHRRIRKKVSGTRERPRLCVYRSLSRLYAQCVDDENSVTLLSCSTGDKDIKAGCKNRNIAAAALLGELVARRAREKGIEKVIFDRGGYAYHGRIKAVADAARKHGLVF